MVGTSESVIGGVPKFQAGIGGGGTTLIERVRSIGVVFVPPEGRFAPPVADMPWLLPPLGRMRLFAGGVHVEFIIACL